MLQHRSSEHSEPPTVHSLAPTLEKREAADEHSPDTISSLLWDNPMLAKELRRTRRESWGDARSMLQQRLKTAMIQGGAISAVGLGLFENAARSASLRRRASGGLAGALRIYCRDPGGGRRSSARETSAHAFRANE